MSQSEMMYQQFVGTIIPEAIITSFLIGIVLGCSVATLLIKRDGKQKEDKE